MDHLCNTPTLTRSRPWYFVAVLLVIAAGLLSRSDAAGLPWPVAKYLGDSLWGLVAFLGAAFLLRRASTRAVAVLAVAFACGVEVAQLYHPGWLDAVRGTVLGGLVLGTPAATFAWADIAAYLAGIGAGVGASGWSEPADSGRRCPHSLFGAGSHPGTRRQEGVGCVRAFSRRRCSPEEIPGDGTRKRGRRARTL